MKTTSSIHLFAFLFGIVFLLSTQQLSAQCPTGQIPVGITLTTDANPQETTFQLRDLSTGSIIFTAPSSLLGPNGTYTFNVCATPGNCLKSELIDAASNGGPAVTITYNGMTFSSPNPGVFDMFETILIGGTNCTDLSPVDTWANYPITSVGDITIGNGNYFGGPIAGGQQDGTVCMGIRNTVNGWISGGEVGVGNFNAISGFNGIKRFGTAPSVQPCGANANPVIDDFHVRPGGVGNSTDCKMADIIPVGTDAVHVPNGVTELIGPGNYTTIEVEAGGTLLAMPGGYTAGELIIDGGRLLPGGGGVLCDVFFQVSNFQMTNGSTVKATINCKAVNIGSNNEMEGFIHVIDKALPSSIGNNNKFELPACPPCEDALNKKGKGDQGFVPFENEFDFDLYPNPVQGDQVQIVATGLAFPARLSLFHISGALAKEYRYNSEAEFGKAATDGLAPGMYICKLDSQDGASRTHKLLVR